MLATVRVVVLRPATATGGQDQQTAPIYVVTFERWLIEQTRPERVDLDQVLVQVPDAQLVRKGATAEVVAIDTRDDADLAALAAQFAGVLTTP